MSSPVEMMRSLQELERTATLRAVFPEYPHHPVCTPDEVDAFCEWWYERHPEDRP